MTDRIKKMTPQTKPEVEPAEPYLEPVDEIVEVPAPARTEVPIEVSVWAMHNSTPEAGHDLTMLGGFVQAMRARGKWVALPSEYVRLLNEFMNEEAS